MPIFLTPTNNTWLAKYVENGIIFQVDEGIEAMLCCWLQQLQEFGGPELDKPDLLKGSVGSLKSQQLKNVSPSSTSLGKAHIIDPRARYNVSAFCK